MSSEAGELPQPKVQLTDAQWHQKLTDQEKTELNRLLAKMEDGDAQ